MNKEKTACGNEVSAEMPKDEIVEWYDRLREFFSEFGFTPHPRFINTMAHADKEKMADYAANYFAITGHPKAKEIAVKTKTAEFAAICSQLAGFPVKCRINRRLEIYYGYPGTGKSWTAMHRYPNAQTVAYSTNAEYLWITIRDAIAGDYPLLLDCFNHLPAKSFGIIKEVLEADEKITIGGETLEIGDGFRIIGEITLEGRGEDSIPASLADRAAAIEHFNPSAGDAACIALFGETGIE